ncbi:MAG: hypothetical protein P0116_05475 [Candidatus Nitrosocosmicus sp.]|nr:hypothetical protein [Candidatus Nitrosocosmicus sp.]
MNKRQRLLLVINAFLSGVIITAWAFTYKRRVSQFFTGWEKSIHVNVHDNFTRPDLSSRGRFCESFDELTLWV